MFCLIQQIGMFGWATRCENRLKKSHDRCVILSNIHGCLTPHISLLEKWGERVNHNVYLVSVCLILNSFFKINIFKHDSLILSNK